MLHCHRLDDPAELRAHVTMNLRFGAKRLREALVSFSQSISICRLNYGFEGAGAGVLGTGSVTGGDAGIGIGTGSGVVVLVLRSMIVCG